MIRDVDKAVSVDDVGCSEENVFLFIVTECVCRVTANVVMLP
jgi:hypothetical protein